MKQFEAVIKVMEANGGYCTLGFLNQEVLKIEGCEWKSKTPFASIRRIVQDERYFFKIRPGLWALNSHKENLPNDIFPSSTQPEKKQVEFNHSYYQGLLVEMGNLKNFDTFVPNQDKNKLFLGKKLCDIVTLSDIYDFGYSSILKKAKTIDVVWFNKRMMPSKIFEVEHSTDIQNSLLKFVELQDFFIDFFIVADKARKREYEGKLSYSAFYDIKNRIKFMSYEDLSELHTKTYQTISMERQYNL